MNVAPAPTPRPPAAHPGNQAATNHPSSDGNALAAAANPLRASAEPELAVVAVLGYN